MTDRRNQAELAQRHSERITTAARIRDFAHDPAVVKWFSEHEAVLVERMILLPTNADEQRRSLALEIQAMRGFRGWLSNTVTAGEHAAKKLQEMSNV